jgi:hypothetical protein
MPPYDHWALMMDAKPHGGGEWHPGLHGHRLRGMLLAWNYLLLLGKAVKALQVDPKGATAAAAKSTAVKPLPEPWGCDKTICGVAPNCATSFEPRVQGDLRDIMAPGGKVGACLQVLVHSVCHSTLRCVFTYSSDRTRYMLVYYVLHTCTLLRYPGTSVAACLSQIACPSPF